MIYDNEYEYDYHNLAENSEDLYEDEYCCDSETDEPWMTLDEQTTTDNAKWDNYYHNLTDEIVDD